MKTRNRFELPSIIAAAAVIAFAMAACMNPSDGTMFSGGGGGSTFVPTPRAAFIGAWGDPTRITFFPDGAGFMHNPTQFNWEASGNSITLTNVAGQDEFEISVNFSVNGGSLTLSNPAGTSGAALTALTAIAQASPFPLTAEDGFMGATMNLSGQVWLYNSWDMAVNDDDLFFWPLTGDRAVIGGYYGYGDWNRITGGTGAITGGQLSFSIGVPSAFEGTVGELFDDLDDFMSLDSVFSNFSISAPNARFAELWLQTEVDGDRYWLDKWEADDVYLRGVFYIYVDRDVSITAGGRRYTWGCDCDPPCDCAEWDGRCYCAVTVITRNLNLNFRAGWNAMFMELELLGETSSMTYIGFTLQARNPAYVRWVTEPTWDERSEVLRAASSRALTGGPLARFDTSRLRARK